MLRAFIRDRFAGGVAVSLVRGEFNHDDGAMIARFANGGGLYTEWERVENPAAEVDPTFVLGGEEARVLLDALALHFQGASDMRLLRQDRDHERGRVDKLLDVVSEIAKGRP